MNLKEIKHNYFYAGDCANSSEETERILNTVLSASINFNDEALRVLKSAIAYAEIENQPHRPWHSGARELIKNLKGD